MDNEREGGSGGSAAKDKFNIVRVNSDAPVRDSEGVCHVGCNAVDIVF